MKRRGRDDLFQFGKRVAQRRHIAHRGAVVAVVEVNRPSAGIRIGSQLEDRPMQVIAGNSGIDAGPGHEKERVHGIVCNDAAVFPMVGRTTSDNQPGRLGFRTQRFRQGGNIAVEDAGVGLQGIGVDRSRGQLTEIGGLEAGPNRQGSHGDKSVDVIGVDIDLMRGPQATERVLVGGCPGNGSDRTVLDHLEDVVVEFRVGVVGHGAT